MNGIIFAVLSVFALASCANVRNSAQDACAAADSDGTLVVHEECSKFYECSGGVPVAFSCPDDLIYNDKTKACDWPENVDCGNRAVKDAPINDEPEQNEVAPEKEAEPKEANDDPSKANEICAAVGSSGTLVAHEECAKFYICHNSEPVAISCGNNPILYYNPESRRCDWPENVNCGSRVVNTETEEKVEIVQNSENIIKSDDTNSYEETAAKICAADDSDGILLPHGDCDKFYECAERLPFTLQCPTSPRLLYNPEFKICDWAVHVDCGDRKQ